MKPADQIVLDISHYQPTPDWTKVKAGGTVGVILKCTEGTTYLDPTYHGRVIGAQENGVLVSSYHFMRPGSMRDQMDWYLKNAAPAPGERLCLDYEDENVSFNDLEYAAQYLFEHTQCEITVYGSNILVEACKGKHSEVLSKTSLWQARYSSSEPAVPTNIWPAWSLWQFTDKGQVDGITGNVDCNRWNGDPKDLPGWFDTEYIAPPAPGPSPEPDRRVVRLDMTVDSPDDVEFVITINGIPVQERP